MRSGIVQQSREYLDVEFPFYYRSQHWGTTQVDMAYIVPAPGSVLANIIKYFKNIINSQDKMATCYLTLTLIFKCSEGRERTRHWVNLPSRTIQCYCWYSRKKYQQTPQNWYHFPRYLIRFNWNSGLKLFTDFWVISTIFFGITSDNFVGKMFLIWRKLFVCLRRMYFVSSIISRAFRHNKITLVNSWS